MRSIIDCACQRESIVPTVHTWRWLRSVRYMIGALKVPLLNWLKYIASQSLDMVGKCAATLVECLHTSAFRWFLKILATIPLVCGALFAFIFLSTPQDFWYPTLASSALHSISQCQLPCSPKLRTDRAVVRYSFIFYFPMVSSISVAHDSICWIFFSLFIRHMLSASMIIFVCCQPAWLYIFLIDMSSKSSVCFWRNGNLTKNRLIHF